MAGVIPACFAHSDLKMKKDKKSSIKSPLACEKCGHVYKMTLMDLFGHETIDCGANNKDGKCSCIWQKVYVNGCTLKPC